MRAFLLNALAACVLAAPSLPWSFSWDTLPTFAFPGPAMPSGNRFMTPTEEAAYVSNYTMLMIWGANARCLAANGSTFAPTCIEDISRCYCDRANPNAQRWVQDMEETVLTQGAALKARAAALGKTGTYPVLGYVEGLSLQQWYKAQAAVLYNASLAPYLLSVASKGVIDCFRDGCDWQGVEMRQIDLRKPEAINLFVNSICYTAMNGPGLDGLFIDAIEWWLDACSKWPCTAAERTALVNASLVASDALLAASARWGKVISLSSHTSLGSDSSYYNAYANILVKYPQTEFWVASDDYVATLVRETQTLSLPVHVHTNRRTMSPDWVELAAFLIGAGEYSYFSYSQNWMLDSWSVPPEFTRALGPPTSPPARAAGPQEAYAPWQAIPSQHLAFGAVSCPNCSLSGTVEYVGTLVGWDACVAAARAAFPSARGVTFVGDDGTKWAHGCWARVDAAFDPAACILHETARAPCYAAAQASVTSAVAVPAVRNGTVTWTRTYAHLNVTYAVGTGAATLVWM